MREVLVLDIDGGRLIYRYAVGALGYVHATKEYPAVPGSAPQLLGAFPTLEQAVADTGQTSHVVALAQLQWTREASMRVAFEFKVLDLESVSASIVEEQLNELGRDGWGIASQATMSRVILQRKVSGQ